MVRPLPAVVAAAFGVVLAAACSAGPPPSIDTTVTLTPDTTSTTVVVELAPTTTAAPVTAEPTPTTAPPTTTTLPQFPNELMVLEAVDRLTGDLASKSVVASDTGLYFAQNMMYRHTISVFNADRELVATIPDSVDLSAFGFDNPEGTYRGAPVEAAFDSVGEYAYVSNYRMYGTGFNPAAGGDSCGNDQGEDSFVYRIDTDALEIDALFPVGSVPKYLAVTPDDRYLIVSNWCTYDVTIIDLASGEIAETIEVGRHPRGIAVTSDSSTAYVTIMGGSDIAVIDLDPDPNVFGHAVDDDAPTRFGLSYLQDVGRGPRHLVLSPDDEVLYVTLNSEGRIAKLDAHTGEELDSVRTGIAPRSMDISDDGTALYVVNYESDTMSKVRTSDFEVLQNFNTAHHPIGITYDSLSNEVWVSAYSGVIHVYAETGPELNFGDG